MNWNKYFICVDGCLYWRKRNPSEFSRESDGRAWNTKFASKKAGYEWQHPSGRTQYVMVCLLNKMYKAHRIIWEMKFGSIPIGMSIDHIDGNGLNNRINNLRIVTHLTNSRNCPKRLDNSSGAPGVSWNKKREKWRAYVTVNKKQKHLGFYSNYGDAVTARRSEIKNIGFHENHGRSASA